jgi:hypothetical protein
MTVFHPHVLDYLKSISFHNYPFLLTPADISILSSFCFPS